MKDVLKDINIIDFAIISTNIEYKTNVYNKMVDKYVFELDSVGYTRALEIENYSFSNLSDESVIRNYLSMLRRWIIRSSGYMCIRKMAELNTDNKVDEYMKKYSIGQEVVDSNTLKQRLDYLDLDNQIANRGKVKRHKFNEDQSRLSGDEILANRTSYSIDNQKNKDGIKSASSQPKATAVTNYYKENFMLKD